MSKEEKGKLRRKEMPEVSEPAINLMPLWLTARCAIQHIRRMYFFFFWVHVQKWICTLDPSQSQQSNYLETSMQARSCANTQLCGYWITSWCMGLFACSFCFYSVLIPRAFVQRSHSCAGKSSVVCVLPFCIGISKQQQSFGISGTQKDSKLVSSYSKQSWDSNEP